MKNKNDELIPAAIYARFSTDNQRQESIEDQVAACKNFASDRGYTVAEDYIFRDEAVSGTTTHRDGLQRLRELAKLRVFKTVITLNCARFARDLQDMLRLESELQFYGINLISVQEGINTAEPHSRLAFQMMGVMNQQYVESTSRETKRGQIGQIGRGFVAGNLGYGYTVDNPRGKGKRKREDAGSKPVVIEHEADNIRRIFRDFISGKSITQIVKDLNAEQIPSRYKTGWAESTVSKILKNEAYTGKYIWGRTGTRKDPMTGKKKKFDRPREEWQMHVFDEMRIITDDVWNQAQARWKELEAAFPRGSREDGWGKRKSYVDAYPPHLFSGAMKCRKCGGAIVIVGHGRSGIGYYGCQMAYARKRCTNRRTVSRLKLEQEFCSELTKRVFHPEAVSIICDSARKAIEEHYKYLPDELRKKMKQLEHINNDIKKYLKLSIKRPDLESVLEEVKECETRKKTVETNIQQIKAAQRRVPPPPTAEAVQDKLKQIQELLEKDVIKSAQLIRQLLGEIKVDTRTDESGKEYLDYSAVLDSLKLYSLFLPDGSSSLTWWRWGESNPRP